MIQKLHNFIDRIKHKFSKERCYDEMEHQEYQERDTKCDKCEFQDQCCLLDCTTGDDTRRHFIPAMGNVCKKEEALYEDELRRKIRGNDYEICKDCPYYYGEIDQCMLGEPDVPDDMEKKCKGGVRI